MIEMLTAFALLTTYLSSFVDWGACAAARAEPRGLSRLTSRAPCEVLVAAAREAHDDQVGVEVVDAGERVCRLERRDDPLGARQAVEGRERLVVGRRDVACAAGVAEERVLGPDARVVEPGRDRVGVRDLAVLVGEHGRARAVQDGRRGPLPRLAAPAASTPTSSTSASSRKPANIPIAFEPPPTQAITASGSRPSTARICSRDSRPTTDCSSRTSSGYGAGPTQRADHVVGRLDVRDPVADRLARRLLQRPRAELDRDDVGAEQVHPLDVGRLPAHVLGAHEDDALEPEPRAGGRCRDAVLAGAGLGDDPRLAEPPGEHDLAERVVDLVRARVVQILALEIDALRRREPLGARERSGAADVLAAEAVELRRGRTGRPWPPPRRRSARRAPGSASPARSVRPSRRT